MGHRHNVVPLLPESRAERLEALARRPLQPHREELRVLAKRLRALKALDHAHDPHPAHEEVA